MFILSLLFIGCYTDHETQEVTLTEADLFVSSTEYQKFSSEVNNFSHKIYERLSTLSDEEREKLDKISTAIKSSKKSDETLTLIKELQELMGIDYIAHSQKMQELSKNLFKNQKFTSEEFTKAIRKHQFLNKTTFQTKTPPNPVAPLYSSTPSIPAEPDSTNTTEPTPSPNLIEECMKGCITSYEISEIICNSSHHHTRYEDTRKCAEERQSVLLICIDLCQQQYPATPPSTI